MSGICTLYIEIKNEHSDSANLVTFISLIVCIIFVKPTLLYMSVHLKHHAIISRDQTFSLSGSITFRYIYKHSKKMSLCKRSQVLNDMNRFFGFSLPFPTFPFPHSLPQPPPHIPFKFDRMLQPVPNKFHTLVSVDVHNSLGP